MADKFLALKISGGKFSGHWGATVNEFKENFVRGNGWKVQYYPDGSIRCKASLRRQNGEERWVLFKISQYGYVRLSKMSGGEIRELKAFRLKEWPCDGVLYLSDGNLYARYAYFHQDYYRSFISRYDISALKRKDPNQLYTLYKVVWDRDGGQYSSETIHTDGHIEEVGKNAGRTTEWQRRFPGTNSFEEYTMIKVSGATWVIIETEGDKERRELYTLEDVRNLSFTTTSK